MNLLTCRLCGKLFTSGGGRTCPACLARLDALYPKIREFLRDHSKTEFNEEKLAEEFGVDIRDVQALVEMGYLDFHGADRENSPEDAERQKLARDFEKSLKQMRGGEKKDNEQSSVSYGQQRYGSKGR